MDFELLTWGDGTIRLTYWNTATGKDIVIVLAEDGQAYLVTDTRDDGTETRQGIDLVPYLRGLA